MRLGATGTVRCVTPDEDVVAALHPPPSEPGVVAVYLFGSAASRRMHRESDVDVGILLDRRVHPTPRARFEARLRLIAELGARVRRRSVDVVVLNDAPPGLGRAVVASRPPVYCSDPDAEHAFRRDVQLRAADLEPFLRRTRRRKLQAIAR